MSASPIRVLVMDDDRGVRLNLCAFLEDEGFTVLSAASGEEALRVLEEGPVDVGIMDIRLPGLDGDAVILRAHALCPRMQFLIHTGSQNYMLSAGVQALGLRQDDVFIKPVFDMSVIAQVIRRKAEGPTE
jgi:DNA-binding NtrC family response regulator